MLQTLSWCQIVVRIFPKEGKITYSDQTQQQKPDKELLEQFEQLREVLRNFNQNFLQIQTWETRTKTGSRLVKEPWEMALRVPRCPPHQQRPQPGKESQGHLLSQAGSGLHTV